MFLAMAPFLAIWVVAVAGEELVPLFEMPDEKYFSGAWGWDKRCFFATDANRLIAPKGTNPLFSVEAWVKPQLIADPSFNVLMMWHSSAGGHGSNGAGWYVALTLVKPCCGVPTLGVDTGSHAGFIEYEFPFNVEDGDYHHVMVSFDGNTWKLYADFVELGSKTWSGQDTERIWIQGNPIVEGFCVGSHSFDNSKRFRGHMKGLKLWGTDLTAEEVKPTTVTSTTITTTVTQTSVTETTTTSTTTTSTTTQTSVTKTTMMFIDVAFKKGFSTVLLLLTTVLLMSF